MYNPLDELENFQRLPGPGSVDPTSRSSVHVLSTKLYLLCHHLVSDSSDLKIISSIMLNTMNRHNSRCKADQNLHILSLFLFLQKLRQCETISLMAASKLWHQNEFYSLCVQFKHLEKQKEYMNIPPQGKPALS